MCLVAYGILLVALTLASAQTLDECVVPIASIHYNRVQWPLIYKPNGELYPTKFDAERQSVTVNLVVDEEVLLSCGPNYLKNYNRAEILNVKCESGGKFSVLSNVPVAKKAPKLLEQFGCDLRVVEEVLSTVNGCAEPTWTAVAFGYVNPQDRLTHIIGEACYDENAGRTIFAHVKLGSGAALQRLPKDFLTKHRHPDGRYKSELFRGLHFDEIYERVRQTLNLKRAPFLHKANFIDDFFLTSPQFFAVRKLAWNYFVAHDELSAWTTLKQNILAHQRANKNEAFDIYVGSHGIQVLRAANGKQMELYLHPAAGEHGKFPVPELLWIIVKEEDKAMAFAVYNDADVNALETGISTSTHAPICESKCDQVSWLSESLKDGAVICCEVAEFRKVIKEVPAAAEAGAEF
ncbi:uncharacterized protein LOC101451905 [Ceratitis capitata]|uniref:(Mediterranean fruit fly) hypothetical protein n=1 Tax=Ceratitis capitata TaxID=7213 RepID=W8B826_CERCA|nr:uncharacterized protein LOC101451905 [Ceratitis capitata]CAD7012540.1 unnamed protein product [Ceratitis capitata]